MVITLSVILSLRVWYGKYIHGYSFEWLKMRRRGENDIFDNKNHFMHIQRHNFRRYFFFFLMYYDKRVNKK